MTPKEIRDRLHRFNLTNDWSVFDDVPRSQQVSVMYPHVIRSNETDEEYKERLNEIFGPLSDEP